MPKLRYAALRYAHVRDDIRDGDLLAFYGRQPLYAGLSLAQRWFYRLNRRAPPDEVPAHVGMAAWICGRLWVLEQNTTGGRLVPLSGCLSDYCVDWFHLTDSGINRDKMLEVGLDALGRPYRYDTLVRLFLFREQISDRTGICSGLYQAALLAGGYDWIDADPMPAECTQLPCLTRIGRLVP